MKIEGKLCISGRFSSAAGRCVGRYVIEWLRSRCNKEAMCFVLLLMKRAVWRGRIQDNRQSASHSTTFTATATKKCLPTSAHSGESGELQISTSTSCLRLFLTGHTRNARSNRAICAKLSGGSVKAAMCIEKCVGVMALGSLAL